VLIDGFLLSFLVAGPKGPNIGVIVIIAIICVSVAVGGFCGFWWVKQRRARQVAQF
jgi:hypothetical protein